MYFVLVTSLKCSFEAVLPTCLGKKAISYMCVRRKKPGKNDWAIHSYKWHVYLVLVRSLSFNPNIYETWSTSELRVRLAAWNRFKPLVKYVYWPFQGGTSFVDHFCSVLCLLCLCACLFICALWSPAGKGVTSWLSFMVSYCKFVTFPLVSCVRCGTWLYRFLICAPLFTLLL